MHDKILVWGASAALGSLLLCSSVLLSSHLEYRNAQESSVAELSASVSSAADEETSAAHSLSHALAFNFLESSAALQAEEREDSSRDSLRESSSMKNDGERKNEDFIESEAIESVENSRALESLEDGETELEQNLINAEERESSQDESEALPETAGDPQEIRYASFSYNDYNVILDTAIGPMMYYNQHDSHWGTYLYGGKDAMSSYGCGPTTAAMIVNAFGNISGSVSPIEMADWSANYGYYATHSGSYHDYIPAVLSAFDLMVDSVQNRSVENVSRILSEGNILVALMGKGALTNGGHFIIITKLNADGTVSIADPNSYNTTTQSWSLEQLLQELKKNYDAGGPLWSVRTLKNMP